MGSMGEDLRQKARFDEAKKKGYENAQLLIEKASIPRNELDDFQDANTTKSRNLFKILLCFLGFAGIVLFVLGICTVLNVLFGGVLWIGILLVVLGILMMGSIFPLYLFKIKKC